MGGSAGLTRVDDGSRLPVDGRGAGAELVQILQAELAAAASYAEAARAASTRRAYAQDWRVFAAWCIARALEPLPADPRAVAVFLASEAARGCAPMTIGRRLAAIGHAHRQHGLQPPQGCQGAAAIVEVMAGIRRSHGKPPARKHAADADVMRDMLRAIAGDDIRSVRDRALLAFGMAGAFRRSELVALQVAQISREPRGLRVQFGRTKTDQDGSGQVIAIPDGRRIRPVQLLEAWLAQAGISEGLVFRKLKGGNAMDRPMSDRAVARVVQARAAAAGRGGSGNLHSGDKWIADLTAAMLAASRRQDEQATASEPQPGVQGQGGLGRYQGREDAGRAGAAV